MATRAAVLLAALALGAAACAWRNPFTAIAKVTEDDERSLGAQVDASIQQQVPLIDDPVVLGFVNDVGQRIVAQIEPQPFIYRFRVIPNSTLNAFALPGGYIYLHSATILQAGSLNELAGVIGHEIGHVKGHHYARGTEKSFWPSLLARAAGIGAAIATGEPGFAAAAEGANVALQLKYSREFESEADEMGAVFMSRAGFDPSGMGRFFERILAADVPSEIEIPPYLYSHPALDQRIDGVKRRGAALHVSGTLDPELEADFRDAQARLAMLIALQRTSVQGGPPYDRAKTDPALARADTYAKAGQLPEAIGALEQAERAEPNDPRVPFRLGELLDQAGRSKDAIAAWRRAIALDPSVALAYYDLGNAYKALGDRHDATYYFEQAERRFKDGGAYQRRTRIALETLSYPPVTEAGLGDGRVAQGDDSVAGAPRERFAAGDAEVVWWATLDKRYDFLSRRVHVRWTDPTGATAQESVAERKSKRRLAAHLALEGPLHERFGRWEVVASIEGQVIDRRTFEYGPKAR